MQVDKKSELSLDESIAIKQSDLSIGYPIGRGGFGEVLIGTWSHDGIDKKTVALKRLLAQELTTNVLSEFKNEVAVQIKLSHENIVKLYGITIVQPYYMVLEFMSNGSLSSYLEETPQTEMTWERRFKIAGGIVAGMAYLHGMSPPIIHGDLKSLNVLLDENYTAKIADFGLAQLKLETASKALTNTSIQSGGSLLWMAPELLGRRTKKTLKSDIYALGWTLWEVASHKSPFYEDCDKGSDLLISFIKSGEREKFPDGTPHGYQVLIEACWDGAIANRPTAVAALAAITVLIKPSTVEPKTSLAETALSPVTAQAMKLPASPRQNNPALESRYMVETKWKPAHTRPGLNVTTPMSTKKSPYMLEVSSPYRYFNSNKQPATEKSNNNTGITKAAEEQPENQTIPVINELYNTTALELVESVVAAGWKKFNLTNIGKNVEIVLDAIILFTLKGVVFKVSDKIFFEFIRVLNKQQKKRYDLLTELNRIMSYSIESTVGLLPEKKNIAIFKIVFTHTQGLDNYNDLHKELLYTLTSTEEGRDIIRTAVREEDLIFDDHKKLKIGTKIYESAQGYILALLPRVPDTIRSQMRALFEKDDPNVNLKTKSSILMAVSSKLRME